MTSRIAQAYDTLVLSSPKLILAVLLSILVFFGYHAKDFKLDASADTLLLEDDADLKVFRKIYERYPSNDLLIVTYTPDIDLFSNQALEPLKRLREELKKVSSVNSVFTILNAPLFNSSEQDLEKMLQDMPSLERPDIDPAKARDELVNSSIYRDLVVSADGRTTALLLEMVEDKRLKRLLKSRQELREKKRDIGLTSEEVRNLKSTSAEYDLVHEAINEQRHLDIAQIRDIIKRYRQYGPLHLGGLPMISDDMVTYVGDDLIVFGGVVLFFLIVILAVIFRRVRWIVLPLLSCFYAGLTMIGVLGLFGWMVTVISSNFLALMLIITLSMNIHLIVRYLQFHRDNPGDDQLALVRITIHKMVRPCLYTALTSIIGFGSLVVSDIKPVIDFGLMMSAGLVVTFATSFLLFPTLLLVMGKADTTATVEKFRFYLPEYLARLTEFHGAKIMVLSVVLTVVSIVGISMLRVENSFINYFSEESEIYQGLKLIDEKLGGTTPVEILIKFEDDVERLTPEDLAEMTEEEIREERAFMEVLRTKPELWFTPTKVGLIRKAHDYLDGLPEIGKVLSLVSSIRVVEEITEEELDGMDMALLYTKIPDSVKKILIEPYISIKDNEVRIMARVVDSKPDMRRKELLEKLHKNLGKENGFEQLADYKLLINDVTVSGMLVLYNNMLQSLFSSQIKSIGVVMLGIGIMFLVLFRSFTLAVIGILPNILSAGVILGIMGGLGIPLDMMTITIAAITIGIAVDDGIHYIYRFKEEYPKTRSYLKTMHICHSSIGKAMVYTTLTIIIGFSSLVLSNFIPTIYFGVLTGAAMFIALMAALTVLPKLILLWKPFG